MFKFFDREGNTLALRPDITPAIARAAAEERYIKSEDIARLIAFRDNPSDESWIGRKG